jgi:hypothetical protein
MARKLRDLQEPIVGRVTEKQSPLGWLSRNRCLVEVVGRAFIHWVIFGHFPQIDRQIVDLAAAGLAARDTYSSQPEARNFSTTLPIASAR